MSATLSVADALAWQSLPVESRRVLMDLVRSAFSAGYDHAVRCADDDIALGMDWRHVPAYRTSCAGLWLTAEALPLLDVDVGCDLDPIYAPSESR